MIKKKNEDKINRQEALFETMKMKINKFFNKNANEWSRKEYLRMSLSH